MTYFLYVFFVIVIFYYTTYKILRIVFFHNNTWYFGFPIILLNCFLKSRNRGQHPDRAGKPSVYDGHPHLMQESVPESASSLSSQLPSNGLGKRVQEFGPLLLTWETQTKLLALPWCSPFLRGSLGNEPAMKAIRWVVAHVLSPPNLPFK